MPAETSPAPPGRAPRRRLRFSLRTALILVTVFCLCLGREVDLANQQMRALKLLSQQKSFFYYYDDRLKEDPRGDLSFGGGPPSAITQWLIDRLGRDYVSSVVGVRLELNQRSDAALDALADLPQLKFLSARKHDAAPSLAALGRMTELVTLELGGDWTDADVAHLENLTRLRRLTLNGHITSAGMAHLARLVDMRVLNLNGTDVTDEGLDHLAGMKKLRVLTLSPYTTDAGLEKLKELPQLEVLYAVGYLTEAGLEHLKNLKNLKKLFIGAKIARTDAGLRRLGMLSQLEELHVTDGGLEAFVPNQLHSLVPEKLIRSLAAMGATDFTDDGLGYLTPLAHLEELWLQTEAITDAGLQHFAGMTRLRRLHFLLPWTGSTALNLSPAAIRTLQMARPGLAVDFRAASLDFRE